MCSFMNEQVERYRRLKLRFRKDDGTEERSERVVGFLRELVALEARYGLALEHEDSHGAFIVRPLTDEAVAWLMDAFDGSEP
jgi:sugar phosphate isomerase/epimerase